MLCDARAAEHVRELIPRADRLFFRQARVFDARIVLCLVVFMHGIVRRTLERLVMLRNRTVDEASRVVPSGFLSLYGAA